MSRCEGCSYSEAFERKPHAITFAAGIGPCTSPDDFLDDDEISLDESR